MDSMGQLVVMWAAIAVVALIVEMMTLTFVSVYVTAGATVAAFLAGFDQSFQVQLVAFMVVGIALLVLTRPHITKRLNQADYERSNVDAVIGMTARVTVAINNDLDVGQVHLRGELWRARSADPAVREIAVDEKVEVVSVEGAAAMVKPV